MISGKQPGKGNPVFTFPHEIMKVPDTRQVSFCANEIPVGSRLRNLRHEQKLSIRALAEKCGISANTLSLIENNRTSPSVHTLNLLANGLGVPLIALFEEEKSEPELVYQQVGQRQKFRFSHGTAEKLGQGLPPLGAEPILVTLDKGRKNTGEISHSGREFIYCLEGEIVCVIAGQEYRLAEGDSLLFDAKAPHRWINTHTTTTRLLVLFCPMEAHDQPAERHLDH